MVNMAEQNGLQTATLAGGCFWCMDPPYRKLPGVSEVIVGYTGGSEKNPTYEEVCMGDTGHFEAVRITYDPAILSYKEILDVFWQQIDPTDTIGQFADKGPQYRSAIFYHSEDQKKTAEDSKAALQKTGKFSKPIATLILPAQEFYSAEDYHQEYYIKNPVRYLMYRKGSGREGFLKTIWGGGK
jgi:methionine-S-sulfoxide reductase